MSHFELDLTNYKERQSARVPEDQYRVRVADTELTTSNSGNPMLNMWLEVIDHPDPQVNGATIIDRLVATENSAFRVVHCLKALGMEPPIGGKLRLPGRALIGRTMIVEVVDGEPYRNRIKSEVAEYYADPDRASGQPTAAQDLPPVDDDRNPPGVGDDLPEPEWPSADEATAPVPADAQERAEAARARVQSTENGAVVDVEDVSL